MGAEGLRSKGYLPGVGKKTGVNNEPKRTKAKADGIKGINDAINPVGEALASRDTLTAGFAAMDADGAIYAEYLPCSAAWASFLVSADDLMPDLKQRLQTALEKLSKADKVIRFVAAGNADRHSGPLPAGAKIGMGLSKSETHQSERDQGQAEWDQAKQDWLGFQADYISGIGSLAPAQGMADGNTITLSDSDTVLWQALDQAIFAMQQAVQFTLDALIADVTLQDTPDQFRKFATAKENSQPPPFE